MGKHKRGILYLTLTIATGIAVVTVLSESAKAEKANLYGKGNFVFKSGETEAAFYAEDIHYLQKEITALFHELEEEKNE